MFRFCYKSNKKVVIKDVQDMLELGYSKKYNISVERYRQIIAIPNMTHELMESLLNKGYDFSNTKLDLQLFAELQSLII